MILLYILLFVGYLGFGMMSLYLSLTLKKEQIDSTTWQFKAIYWHGVTFAFGFSILGFLLFTSFMIKTGIKVWLQ